MSPNTALKILQLSDIHGADFLINKIHTEISNADVIVLVGDITHFGNIKAVKTILESISAYNCNLLAVSGNCDLPEIDDYLNEKGYGLNQRIRQEYGIEWTGISGSLPCPGETPNEYSEEELNSQLSKIADEMSNSPFVLVAHQPPYKTLNDRLENGLHVGSRSVRKFIEKNSPLLCLTAHIHEGIGMDRINSCQIVNPGSFREGKYAIITISGENSVNVELRQITL